MVRYGGSHYWHIYGFYGRYTGDGLWGSILGAIGGTIGVTAGRSFDYYSFRSSYVAASVFVSVVQSFCSIYFSFLEYSQYKGIFPCLGCINTGLHGSFYQ